MNDVNWFRSRLQNTDAARRCNAGDHAFAPPDPITGERHCTRRGCLSHTPHGRPYPRDVERLIQQANHFGAPD